MRLRDRELDKNPVFISDLVLDNATLRMVIGHVTFACIDNVSGNHVLNEGKLKAFGVKIMKKYVDAATEQEKVPKELQALFSLQSLVTRLEHPNKLLHSIFDVLYEVDIISEVSYHRRMKKQICIPTSNITDTIQICFRTRGATFWVIFKKHQVLN